MKPRTLTGAGLSYLTPSSWGGSRFRGTGCSVGVGPEELSPTDAVDEAARALAPTLIPLLLPYQQVWVGDASQGKVCVKSRRIGISWASAIEAVMCAAKRRGEGSDVWYMCQSERDAKQFIRDAGRYTRLVNQYLIDNGHPPIVKDVGSSIMVTKINFASGHTIEILPGMKPDALRGKGGFVIFDEAALLDLELCRDAADAFGNDMKGGRVAFISTQRGEGNEFNKLVKAIEKGDPSASGYTLHKTTLEQAIAQGFYRRWCQMRGVLWSAAREKRFFDRCQATPGAAQEFNCVPARDGEQYLSRELVEQAMRGRTMAPITWQLPSGWETKRDEHWRREMADAWIERELRPHLERLVPWEHHSVGWDFGRSARGDLSAAAPIALKDDGERRQVPFVVELTGVPHNQQRQIMEALLGGLPNLDGGMFDAGGNGSFLAEQAEQAFGDTIEGVSFRRSWYEEFVPKYKAALQADEIGLPFYPALLQDHSEFELDDSTPVLPKKRKKSTNGLGKRHGDAALACIMAYAASIKPRVSFAGVGPVPRRDEQDEGIW